MVQIVEEPKAKMKEQQTPAKSDCARDRLIAFMDRGPFITKEEGEAIRRVVREAREASIGDPLPS